MKRYLDWDIDQSGAEALSSPTLIRFLAEIWADPDLRSALYGRAQFARDLLRCYGEHAYLSPAQRQELSRLLFAGDPSLQKRCLAISGLRTESAQGIEPA
jgi:hypothetical protein